jgi:hypothetical protein
VTAAKLEFLDGSSSAEVSAYVRTQLSPSFQAELQSDDDTAATHGLKRKTVDLAANGTVEDLVRCVTVFRSA